MPYADIETLGNETFIPDFYQGDKEDELIGPYNVIANAFAAKTVYDRIRENHEKRSHTYVRIQGMIDGNPPYSQRTLKRGGLQTCSNVNWRDAEAIYESVSNAFWSLFNDVQSVAEITTDIADPRQNAEIGKVASEELDRSIRRWRKFAPYMAQHQADMIKFGSSSVFWPNPKSWQFEVPDLWKFLIPERTENDASDFSIVCIEHVMSIHELWAVMESGGEAWNKDVVAQILTRKMLNTDQDQYSGNEFAEVQRQIRNGDTSIYETFASDIALVSIFVKELDGKVTRGIFDPDLIETNQSGWAYFADRQFEKMEYAIQHFTFTPGERYAHGNKGIGHKIFNTVEGISQIDNALMDSIRRASTVLIKSRATRGKDPKQYPFVMGGFVDIGESDFVQNLMGANLASSIEGVRYFRNKLEANNNISGAFMTAADAKPRTASEVNFQVTKESRVQKIRIAHYYDQLDYFFRELVRKMLLSKDNSPGHEYVKMWKDRCIARGVPEEFFKLSKENEGLDGLPEHMEVRATRASGSGSQFADQVEVSKMMNIISTLGERGRLKLLEDYISAHRGFRFIHRYMPPEDTSNQPTGEDTLASVENNQLEQGEMVVVSPDNNHAVHAQRHIQRMSQIAQSFNQAEDAARAQGSNTPSIDAEKFGQYSLEETDVAFQTLGPHITRHLLHLQQDPTRKALVEQLTAQWRVLANFADKIANNAQEHRRKKVADMQKQEEEMNKLDMEERVKMREIEVDLGVKLAKLRGDMQRAANRDSMEYMLERQKISFDNELKREQAAADLQRQANENAQGDLEETTGRKGTELY